MLPWAGCDMYKQIVCGQGLLTYRNTQTNKKRKLEKKICYKGNYHFKRRQLTQIFLHMYNVTTMAGLRFIIQTVVFRPLSTSANNKERLWVRAVSCSGVLVHFRHPPYRVFSSPFFENRAFRLSPGRIQRVHSRFTYTPQLNRFCE